MRKVSFWKVLKGNIECALCKKENCKVRYYPNQEKQEFITGGHNLHLLILKCPIKEEKRKNNILNKKLP